MRRGQITALLLQPSFFSGLLSVMSSLVLLGAANWPSLTSQPLLQDYFFGPGGLVTLFRNSPDAHGAPLQALFSQTLLNNLIMLVAAFCAGLLLLVVLEIIRRAREDAVPLSRHEGRVRLGTRILVIVFWVLYAEITIKMILPFCILATQVGIHLLWQAPAFGYLLFGVLLLAASLHIHVIFMRLFLLRIRVFGGQEAVMRAELDR